MKKFDSHMHIISYDFEIKENNGYLPPSYDINDYLNEVADLNIIGGAIVSGSFQGYDQSYLVDALNKLDSHFVGVTQLPHTVTDEQLLELNEQKVRGLRINVKRGGSEGLSKLEYFAQRVYETVGWHTELYIDSKNLQEISDVIKRLPAVSIDHLGLSKEGMPQLLRLVDKGVHVKATGFSRGDLEISKTLKEIYNCNPNALMFGTDLPSTRAPYRFSKDDINTIEDQFNEDECKKIFFENALNWYRIKS
ncbi:TPA: amidohydrolase family protein [Staphylococcus aureus]|nr:amidohydrolase family protein [Staphylococcus aureus]